MKIIVHYVNFPVDPAARDPQNERTPLPLDAPEF
jgi:hypothetical protein